MNSSLKKKSLFCPGNSGFFSCLLVKQAGKANPVASSAFRGYQAKVDFFDSIPQSVSRIKEVTWKA
jgi:hypothetical protein